jgi:predicted dehydrogenase
VELHELLNLDLSSPLPKDRSRGIGIVGAGGIVNAAHMPAYRKAGLNVVAIHDARLQAARSTADRFGIPVVCESVSELLNRPDIEVIDIAVTPEAQIEIAGRAIGAGKHVLCQKPLSEDLESAVKLVEAAEAAGVRLAVNQQMRWSSAIRFAYQAIKRGGYGVLTECQFDVDVKTDWGWMGERKRLEYLYSSIHYFDAVRHLLGEPVAVIASSAVDPHQTVEAETRTFTILEYSPHLRALVISNHNNWSGVPRAMMRCHGTEGRSEVILGVRDNPASSPDTITFALRSTAPWTFSRRFDEAWLPDSFLYPMADLICAIEEERPPGVSGRDNLNTLKILHAAYRSIEQGRRVELSEFSR